MTDLPQSMIDQNSVLTTSNESLTTQPDLTSEPPNRTNLGDSLKGLFLDGLRATFYLRPRLKDIPASPRLMYLLVMFIFALTVAIERLSISGEARFYWQAFSHNWIWFAATAWICYHACFSVIAEASNNIKLHTAQLLVLILTQGLIANLIVSPWIIYLAHSQAYLSEHFNLPIQWGLYLADTIWIITTQLVLIWRAGNKSILTLVTASVMWSLCLALQIYTNSGHFWAPVQTETEDAAPRKDFVLTQESMEAQPVLLNKRLDEITAQRPELIDLYTITFAPHSRDNVFHNETAMVSDVMAKRFDAQGHGIQLVNHVDTLETLPWATNLNLQRSIERIASLMDKEQDILFIHLSSHGGSDGELSASFWPMEVASLNAATLNQWLDDAGIKNRVISVSACYSGTWIKPLANANSLVMTAADADHTSYGCGKKSKLTFFGRAMYDEQLRSSTLSFEQAFNNARPIIKQREEAEKKDDGYSNPQVSLGANIRQRLVQLQRQLQPAP